MMDFDTPILFLIFNRPNLTNIVFAEIKKIRPKKIFIAADGPRYPLIREPYLCFEARKIINQIDWPCEIYTLLRDENLGCGKAVKEALDWFFSQVEEGIILEDDCLPNQEFFHYCANMLKIYRNNDQVMSVSGANFLEKKFLNARGHYLGIYGHIWGWATWRRAWLHYDFDMQKFYDQNVQKSMRDFIKNDFLYNHLIRVFTTVLNKKNDTWDAQWYFACLVNQAKFVCVFQNLVSNIGHIGTNFESKLNLHDHRRYPINLFTINQQTTSNRLINKAQLCELQYIGIYPNSIFYWNLRKLMILIYEKITTFFFKRRFLKFEGYCSAIEWRIKMARRRIKKNAFLLTWEKSDDRSSKK